VSAGGEGFDKKEKLIQFRESVYQNLNNRADTLMDLVDAMCSRPKARSVVEYSLAACSPAAILNLRIEIAIKEEAGSIQVHRA